MRRFYHPEIKHHEPAKTRQERHYYYWIWFDRNDTHKGLWGAYNSYEEAERKAVSKLNVPYEIVKLPTRDETEASRMMRAGMLDKTGDINRSFSRFSHAEEE